MIVVGIVGGICSGKSFVARQFDRHLAYRIDADKIGHAVLRLPQVKRAIHDEWGGQVFDSDGDVVRAQLAAAVFTQEPGGLEKLEAISHPHITARLETHLREIRDSASIVVLDAPLLFKAGWDQFCNRVLFVDCPYPIRLARAAARGWTGEMLASREKAQTDITVKQEKSTDFVDGTLAAHRLELVVDDLIRVWSAMNLKRSG